MSLHTRSERADIKYTFASATVCATVCVWRVESSDTRALPALTGLVRRSDNRIKSTGQRALRYKAEIVATCTQPMTHLFLRYLSAAT